MVRRAQSHRFVTQSVASSLLFFLRGSLYQCDWIPGSYFNYVFPDSGFNRQIASICILVISQLNKSERRKKYLLLAHPCIRPWYDLYIVGPWWFRQVWEWMVPITRPNRCSTSDEGKNDSLLISRLLTISYLLSLFLLWLWGCSKIPLQLLGHSYFVM